MAHCVLDIYGVSEYPAESGTLFPVGVVLGSINKVYARVSTNEHVGAQSSLAEPVPCSEQHTYYTD